MDCYLFPTAVQRKPHALLQLIINYIRITSLKPNLTRFWSFPPPYPCPTCVNNLCLCYISLSGCSRRLCCFDACFKVTWINTKILESAAVALPSALGLTGNVRTIMKGQLLTELAPQSWQVRDTHDPPKALGKELWKCHVTAWFWCRCCWIVRTCYATAILLILLKPPIKQDGLLTVHHLQHVIADGLGTFVIKAARDEILLSLYDHFTCN